MLVASADGKKLSQKHSHSINVYFIALPDPVAMPTNITMHFVYDERRTPYLATPTINVGAADLLLQVGGDDDVALSFTHVPAAPAEYQVRPAAAIAALEYFKRDTNEVKPVKPDDFNGPGGRFKAARIVTVAQVAVFDDSPPDAPPRDTELEDLSDPTLRALHCVEHFVRSYNLNADVPARLPTYARVGPTIPALRRTLPVDPLSEWQVHLLPLNHDNVGDRPVKPLEMETIGQIMQNVQLLSAGDIRAVFQSEAVEAQRLYFAEGDYASSIVKSAQACEILFDGVLGLLLWEEIGDAPSAEGPVEASVGVFSKPLIKMVRTEFHIRLGGRWNPGDDGPVGDWSRRVAGPRNRIVHRGYRPSADEAGEALEAIHALDEYVSGLVAANVKKFPRTALMWVTERGLKERGQWLLIRAFAKHRRPIEPPWRDNYSAWRERADAAVSGTQYKR